MILQKIIHAKNNCSGLKSKIANSYTNCMNDIWKKMFLDLWKMPLNLQKIIHVGLTNPLTEKMEKKPFCSYQSPHITERWSLHRIKPHNRRQRLHLQWDQRHITNKLTSIWVLMLAELLAHHSAHSRATKCNVSVHKVTAEIFQ